MDQNIKEYNRPIQWLRGVAVLAVIVFHFDKNLLPGGYLGVDLFLVISGYLVGGSIIKNRLGSLDELLKFIEKRFWRLVPALFVVILFGLILFSILATPDESHEAIKAAMSSLFGVSNIYFWTSGGYFAGSTDYNFLLHTWSLSLEWQYYLTFAILCLLAFRLNQGSHLDLILAFVFLLSFVLSVLGSHYFDSANFYLLPGRFWEFIAGTIVWRLHNSKQMGQYSLTSTFLGINFGFVLIILSLFFIDDSFPNPGYWTLLPVLGASIVVFFSPYLKLNRRFVVADLFDYIGKISYSSYLLHWPIAVVISTLLLKYPEWRFALFCIYFALAIAFGGGLYRLVEQPFHSNPRYQSATYLVWPTLGFIAAGVWFISLAASSFVFPLSGYQERVLHSSIEYNVDRSMCLSRSNFETWSVAPYCDERGVEKFEGQKRVAIWGDSHLEPLRALFEDGGPYSQYDVHFYGTAGCPPLLDVDRLYGRKHCDRYASVIFDYLLNNLSDYEFLIVGGRFSAYLYGNTSSFGPAEGGLPQLIKDTRSDSADLEPLFEERFTEVISAFSRGGGKVVLYGSVPEFGYAVPRSVYAQLRVFENFNREAYIRTLNSYGERYDFVDGILKKLALVYDNVGYVDPKSYLCRDSTCSAFVGDDIAYFDDDHLNRLGVYYISPIFSSELK